MNIYRFTNEELETIFITNKLYSKGIENGIDKSVIIDKIGNMLVYIEDFGNILILKRKCSVIQNIEINFIGDGCYLSCLYVKNSSKPMLHVINNNFETNITFNNRISLFSGYFGRNGNGKIIINENTTFETIQIIIKQSLIKQIAEIDGKHSKLFELEYQQKLDKSILLDNIYSPTAILIIEQILNTKYAGQLKAKYIEIKTIELMLHLMNLSISNIKCDTKNSIAERAMIYIENSYNKNIKIEDIAKHLMVSKANLKLKFREKFNINITDMINKLRMMEVQKLIELGYTFAEIADLLQYKNQTNLKNRYFEWCKKNI